ncbi:MAG: cysteine-rich CWC family protein [Colwellia sp.]|nr:cysteine-rich CWC family protein [Colwellia sp.]
MTLNPNVSHCPLCQQKNRCEIASLQGCWCLLEKVPKALIQQVSDEDKDKVCICQACIKKFNLTKEDNFTSL